MRSLLALALLFATAAQADTKLNILGGLDFATMTNSSDSVYRSTHLMFGTSADFGLTEVFYLQPGLRYVEKGAGVRSTSGTTSIDIDFKIKYLEIPLYAKYLFPMEGKFRPFIFAGPNIGIRVGDSLGYTIVASGATVSGKISGALGENLNSVNLCVDGGLGGQVAFSESWGGTFTAAYSLGLTDVSSTTTGNDSTKTRDIQAYVGAYFNL